jgi:lysophospholipase L1-like esterase
MNRFLSLLFTLTLCSPLTTQAQKSTFDFTRPQPLYSDSLGYGYDLTAQPPAAASPFYFSVKVPDGNYRVTVTLGSPRRKGNTVVRAESRRLMMEEVPTRKGERRTVTFVVNKRSPQITEGVDVKLKPAELGYLDWDNRLTLEFNGAAPAVSQVTIEPDTTAVTLFLCGNSTVVDQSREPWASWGQMVTRWFGPEVAISNHAESGLSAATFLGGRRLDKVLAMLRPGDYVFCEFGHNDQKERRPGDGAWYGFSYHLKVFIDRVRQAGGHIIFVTPTQRRAFSADSLHILETHGDYPDAMRAVAQREQVPVIELHDLTRTFFETLGYENSKRALVHYPAHTFPGQEQALADNTHFNPYGAYEVAKMVVMGMKQLHLPFTQYLRPEFHDYDPAHPDDFRTFVWHPASMTDVVKPDGN